MIEIAVHDTRRPHAGIPMNAPRWIPVQVIRVTTVVARNNRVVQRDTHVREGGVERLETTALPVRPQSLVVVGEVGREEIGHDLPVPGH